jgi:hypothetical protein
LCRRDSDFRVQRQKAALCSFNLGHIRLSDISITTTKSPDMNLQNPDEQQQVSNDKAKNSGSRFSKPQKNQTFAPHKAQTSQPVGYSGLWE